MAALLGLDGSIGLTDILAGRLRSQQVIQPWAGGSFDVLVSGPLPPNPSELLASRQMAALLGELRARYDVVLVDSPPLLPVTDAAALSPATDGAILVCRFKKTTREQVGQGAAALAAVSVPLLGTVFTMVARSGSRAYAHYNVYYPAGRPPTVATRVLPANRAAADADRSWTPTHPRAAVGHSGTFRSGHSPTCRRAGRTPDVAATAARRCGLEGTTGWQGGRHYDRHGFGATPWAPAQPGVTPRDPGGHP